MDTTQEKTEAMGWQGEGEKFNLIFEANPNPMAITSAETHAFTDVNLAFLKTLGYSKEEVLGKLPEDLSLFLDPESQKAIARDLMEKGFIRDKRLQIRTKTGEARDGIFSGNMIRSAGKEYLLTVMVDDTERRKLNERYENIIAGMNLGTWEWNVQTGETVFNERWAQIIGYTLEELKPISIKTWERFAHPDDLQGSDRLLQEHFAGKTDKYAFESRMKHKDGSWVWVYDSGKVMEWDKDGKPTWMFGAHLDITRIKNAEEKAVEAEELYRSILDNSTDLIFLIDKQNVILSVNTAFAGFLGHSVAGIVGKPILAVLPTATAEALLKDVNDVIENGTNVLVRREISTPTKDILVEASFNPIRRANGEIVSVCAIMRDITDREGKKSS